MSALADALGKQYASGTMDEEELRAALTEIGQNDPADTSQWIAALDIIRATGAALPRENGAANGEAALAASLTDSERAYVVGKLGEAGLSLLFGATR